MRINLEKITLQCLGGRLSEQTQMDALLLFADTWLQPFGVDALDTHAVAGNRLRGACAHAGPLGSGSVAVTEPGSLNASAVYHAVVSSYDHPVPDHTVIEDVARQTGRIMRANRHRSLAFSPMRCDGLSPLETLTPIVSGLCAVSNVDSDHLMIRIVVPEELSLDDFTTALLRSASLARAPLGA